MNNGVYSPPSKLPESIDDGLVYPLIDLLLFPDPIEVVSDMLLARSREKQDHVFVILIQGVVSDISLETVLGFGTVDFVEIDTNISHHDELVLGCQEEPMVQINRRVAEIDNELLIFLCLFSYELIDLIT